MQMPVCIMSPQILNCLHLVVLHKIVLVTLNMLGTCNTSSLLSRYSLLVVLLSLLHPFFVLHSPLWTVQRSRAVI